MTIHLSVHTFREGGSLKQGRGNCTLTNYFGLSMKPIFPGSNINSP